MNKQLFKLEVVLVLIITDYFLTFLVAKRKPVKPTSKKTGRTSKMSSIRDSHDSQVAHRMLSARRLKVNELRNRVEELNQQLYEVERENKLLKRQNVMKDRVIDKHEGEDSEVSIKKVKLFLSSEKLCKTNGNEIQEKKTSNAPGCKTPSGSTTVKEQLNHPL